MNYSDRRLTPAAQAALNEYLVDYAEQIVDRAYDSTPNGEVKVTDLMSAIRDDDRPILSPTKRRKQAIGRRLVILGMAYSIMGVVLSFVSTLLDYSGLVRDIWSQSVFGIGGMLIALIGLMSVLLGFKRVAPSGRLLGSSTPTPDEWVDEQAKESQITKLLAAWNQVERTLSSFPSEKQSRSSQSDMVPVHVMLRNLSRVGGPLPRSTALELERLRRIRNQVVHGDVEDLTASDLREAAEALPELNERLKMIRSHWHGSST